MMETRKKAGGLLRKFVALNRNLSRGLYLMAARVTSRRPGVVDFERNVVPGLLFPDARVLDVGGGKCPIIDAETKRALNLYVVGLDISADELARAPANAYDKVIVGDVTTAPINERFDVILSRTLLEHVPDTSRAIANLASALDDGGTMAHYVPCRRALFAALSRCMGPETSRSVLFRIYPEKRSVGGFPAYYDCCIPSEMARLCRACGLQVETRAYFESEYFNFFAPLYAAELLRQLTMMWLKADDFAETFVVIARKSGELVRTAPLSRAA